MGILQKLKLGYCVARYLGTQDIVQRAAYYLSRATGCTRRQFQSRPWNSIALADIASNAPSEPDAYAQFKRTQEIPFLFPLGKPPVLSKSILQADSQRKPTLLERLDLLRQGRCVMFFDHPSREAIDWHRNPVTGDAVDSQSIWCDIPDYSPEHGDPRTLWEPSRATWAFDLSRARAWGNSGVPIGKRDLLDERQSPDELATLFVRWLDSWTEANPPFHGFQWKCGQESSVRVIAILWAAWALGDCKTIDGRCWTNLARLAWATGYRIEHAIAYALSQKNNHAISESVGLMGIAHLFPEFRDAKRWWKLGYETIQGEMRRQVYQDGSYCQQSTNYQRVMMQGALLATRLAELSDTPFPREIYELLDRCNRFLVQISDPSGHVPKYGNNDGAWVLPLGECDYWDFRPLLQSVHQLVHGERLLPPGPWDEDTVWLFGDRTQSDLASPIERTSSRFEIGGYYTLRQDDSWAMIRCHNYRDRVGHCDPMHVDLWWNGVNVLCDNGTYRYYQPEHTDVEEYFSSTRAHNSVLLDGRDSMQRMSRFQRFPFTRCSILQFSNDKHQPLVSARFHGYESSPWHSQWIRTVVGLGHDYWMIIDDVTGESRHTVEMFYHLGGDAFQPTDTGGRLSTEFGPWGVAIAANHSIDSVSSLEIIENMTAPQYGSLSKSPAVRMRVEGPLPLRLVSLLGPGVEQPPRLVSSAAVREQWKIETPTLSGMAALTEPGRPVSVDLGSLTAFETPIVHA